mmetsp:Transcript_23983/g.57297  ORF Transcript_23983/g.57297 Transcript_23983/m.57297 type:complete len:265 (+) Transcript_23983:481-1275(+)
MRAHATARESVLSMHTLTSALQPLSCTSTTCGCARIASVTTSIIPASAAACLLAWHRNESRREAPSATRATATFARSAATTSASPISAIAASIGGASCGAGPTRCRCRRPPSSVSTPSSALTRPASGCRAATCRCSCWFCPRSSWHSDWNPSHRDRSSRHSDCRGATTRRQIAKGQAKSCAATSDSIPAQPQPAAEAAQTVGTCGQASRWIAFAPRVVVSPQCSQLHSRVAIARSAARLRLALATGWRHSGQRRGSRRFQQSAQ